MAGTLEPLENLFDYPPLYGQFWPRGVVSLDPVRQPSVLPFKMPRGSIEPWTVAELKARATLQGLLDKNKNIPDRSIKLEFAWFDWVLEYLPLPRGSADEITYKNSILVNARASSQVDPTFMGKVVQEIPSLPSGFSLRTWFTLGEKGKYARFLIRLRRLALKMKATLDQAPSSPISQDYSDALVIYNEYLEKWKMEQVPSLEPIVPIQGPGERFTHSPMARKSRPPARDARGDFIRDATGSVLQSVT